MKGLLMHAHFVGVFSLILIFTLLKKLVLKSKENKFFGLKLYIHFKVITLILFLMTGSLIVAIDHFNFGTK